MQDLEKLASDAESWEALVWQGADPLLDGSHHAAVDERLLQILPGDKLPLHSVLAHWPFKHHHTRRGGAVLDEVLY